MTQNDADRLEGLHELVREATEEIEAFDDRTFARELALLVDYLERQLASVVRAKMHPRLAPVVEFPGPRAVAREPVISLHALWVE